MSTGLNEERDLSAHESWVYFDDKMNQVANGQGCDSLKEAMPEDKCGFAFFRLFAENVGNAGAGIMTEANIVLQWKGPNSSAMSKVKANGFLQKALDTCPANKGSLEVLAKGPMTTDVIYDKWRPGSGSKVIDD